MDYSLIALAVSVLNTVAIASIAFRRMSPELNSNHTGIFSKKREVKVFKPGSGFGAHIVNELKQWADTR